jgi:hypothetical protein
MEQAELVKEFREFAQLTASALQNHKETLERHEQNLLCAFNSAKGHTQAIEQLRENLHALADAINKQNVAMAKLEKVLSNLGMEHADEPQVN